jgi:CspA family cold shock protein
VKLSLLIPIRIDIALECGMIVATKQGPEVVGSEANGFDYSIKESIQMKGKIARLTDRGFGFITPETGDKDLFFHARSLVDGLMYDSLKEGEEVEFDLEDGEKGPAAVNVRVA